MALISSISISRTTRHNKIRGLFGLKLFKFWFLVNWVLQDHYKVLEFNCDASDDEIRSSFIHLALKWHPDKFKEEDSATSRFQEINEAYQGVVHSVEPYGRSSSSLDRKESEPKDEEIRKLRGRRVRKKVGIKGIERGEGGKRIENRVNGGKLRNGISQVYEMTLQNDGRYQGGS